MMDALLDAVTNNAVASAVSDIYRAFSRRRAELGLANPGPVEKIAKEIHNDVFLSSVMYSGLRAEVARDISLSPLFHVSHQFFMGDRQSPYTFGVTYGSDNVFMLGSLDNEGTLSSRFNIRTGSSAVARANVSLAPGGANDMVQLEQEYAGNDFTTGVKLLNPSYMEGGLTGMMVGSYMQSVTPRLALGLESVWQRPSMRDPPQSASSYLARLATNRWIATAHLQSSLTAFNATYWRKLSDRVQAGIDMNLSLMPGPSIISGLQKEGVTTLGAKYQFRFSTLRFQFDSWGKLAMLMEKQVAPMMIMTFAVDVDHRKQQAKLGMGLAIHAGGEELQEQQMMGVKGPNIPV